MLHKLIEKRLLSNLVQDKFMSICEVLFEYGSNLLRDKDMQAITWLKACQELVFTREEESFVELRTSVLQNLARAYLSRNEEGDLEQVNIILDFATENHPVASWLYLLKVEYAAKRHPQDAKPMANVLESMVRIVQITQLVFHSLIGKIYDLHKLDIGLACKILDLLLPKTAEADQPDWIERVLVTRIWLATQSGAEDHQLATIESLKNSIEALDKKLKKEFSPKAIHGCQIVSSRSRTFVVQGIPLTETATVEGIRRPLLTQQDSGSTSVVFAGAFVALSILWNSE